MLPEEVSSLSQGILSPYLVERCRRLENDVAQIHEKCSVLGSPLVVQAFNRCADELEIRLGFVWDTLRRVLRTGQIELHDGIEADIETELRSFRELIMADLLRILHVKADPLNIELEGGLNIAPRWDEAVQRVVGEVHLEVYGLRSAAKRLGQSGSIHFHGPVGAYQTGTYASAQVVRNVSLQAVGELQSILQNAADQLAGASEPAELVAEASRTVDESKLEAAKRKPDWLKLIPALNALVSLLERIPNVRPAFYALRGWFSAHIPMP